MKTQKFSLMDLSSVCFRSFSGLYHLHHGLFLICSPAVSFPEGFPSFISSWTAFSSFINVCSLIGEPLIHPHRLFVDIVLKWWPNTGLITGAHQRPSSFLGRPLPKEHHLSWPEGSQDPHLCKWEQLRSAFIPLHQIVAFTWSRSSL